MMISKPGFNKILIVDDNPNNLFVLSEIISAHFPRTALREAKSGFDALSIVNSETIDLILMDVQMPEMDGFETAKLIHGRSKTAHIPIIFITAFDPDLSKMSLGLEAGGIDYLTKPINDHELIRLLMLYQRFIIREREVTRAIEQVNSSLNSEIKERIRAEQVARKLNEELEQRVHDRTAKLRNEIEERKKIEAQLKQSQAEITIVNLSLKEAIEEVRRVNDAKSMFLASMSHEIRTPMNSILGFTELLLGEETDSAKREKLEIIHYSGSFLLGLINDILDLSKIEAGKMELHREDFSLARLLANIYNVMKVKADEKKIELSYVSQLKNDVWVHSDRKALSQILMNLLSNAIKFTEKGFVKISAILTDKALTVDITDSGIGIPDHKRESIFEAFEQAHGSKRDGTGLGLAITKKLVDFLDGQISVVSKVREGSVFSVVIPMKQVLVSIDQISCNLADGICPPGSICDLEERLSRLRILVVDDNEINLKLMTGILSRQGMHCDLANSGKKALEMLHNADYQIVFLDIQMPEMDGLEVLKKIRSSERIKDIHVVSLTANAMEGNYNEYIAAGFDQCLTKPIIPDQLRKIFVGYVSS